VNIPLPFGYHLAFEARAIYLYKGPDFYYHPGQLIENGAKMRWFMVGIHLEGWRPRIRYESIEEF
jgi:hypothetical protein